MFEMYIEATVRGYRAYLDNASVRIGEILGVLLKRRPKNEDLRPKTPWTKTKTLWTKTKTPLTKTKTLWTKTKTPLTETTDASR